MTKKGIEFLSEREKIRRERGKERKREKVRRMREKEWEI